MVNFEIEKSYTGPVIGLDEVGRGPLAGPVISCGCIFTDYDYLQDKLKFIDDSKKITSKKRKIAFNHLLKLIKKNLLIYKLGMATVKEIDEMNILEATKLSMKRVIDKFNLSKANLIIDGNFKLNYKNYSEQSIIKGDQLSISIATASIIAKIHRDRLMTILSKKFTQFTWNKNAGYGTKQHLKELISNGPTIYHRKSFEPIKSLIHNK